MEDLTSKRIFFCTVVSILLILLNSTISSNSGFVSIITKVLVLFILGYALLLNVSQINKLKIHNSENPQITSQVKLNVIGGYIFTLFLALLFIYIITSFAMY
jgi:L-asparagine transporter-like permease